MPAFQAGDAGSIPATRTKYALVAQWIEQETSKLLVVGSIPTQGTIDFRTLSLVYMLFVL